jgi:hypothetical protein
VITHPDTVIMVVVVVVVVVGVIVRVARTIGVVVEASHAIPPFNFPNATPDRRDG